VSRRALFALPVLAAGTLMLAACQKPLPQVTVSGDGTVLNLKATGYCFSPTQCREGPVRDYGDAPSLRIDRGSDILIDVPRAVATTQWVVSGFTLDDAGTQTPIDGVGTPALHDTHSARILTTAAGSDPFYVSITQLQDSGQLNGTWVVKVVPRN
jgi:hypothetical protein